MTFRLFLHKNITTVLITSAVHSQHPDGYKVSSMMAIMIIIPVN